MSFALCGIAVGSGVLFPNFGSGSTANRRDDNSAKIVSGFGGTFCFLLSLVYIVIVIGAEAIPMYMEIGDIDPAFLIVGSWIFVSLLSFGAAWLPMRLALKRVEAFEI
jgi:ABC-2 type transport system permease protein